MVGVQREFVRPVVKPGEMFDRFIGDEDPAVKVAAAHDTAWALLDRVQSMADPELVQRVLRLVEAEGIDDIARLWSNAHEASLPGLLWRLYLLQTVVSGDPQQASVMFDHGNLVITTIDPIVAGAQLPITPETVRMMCDEILRGAFTGDFAIALERAASASEVFAAGAADLADSREATDEVQATKLTRQALRFSEIAEDFRSGARAWRTGLVH